jgi:hypothetical protein
VCRWRYQGTKIVVGEPQSMEVKDAQMLEDGEAHLGGESEKTDGI